MRQKQIWQLQDQAIRWNCCANAHMDNYEMSGAGCDTIVEYGVDDAGRLVLWCSCYYPTLRTIPNDTHATLESVISQEHMCWLYAGDHRIEEYPMHFQLDGTLSVESKTELGIRIKRQFFPAAEKKCSLQALTICADKDVEITVLQPQERTLGYILGTKGVYITRVQHDLPPKIRLKAGEEITYSICFSAAISNEKPPMVEHRKELQARYQRIRELCENSLVVSTGVGELDAMVRFAKLRCGESIFDTLTGKNLCPGGRRYYAAVWCNDQVEYAGPHFAMSGDAVAIEACLNAYRAYIPFMGENYGPIPSSVIAEGLDIWNGAGDRGDAAMYLYGASLFCLYLGDRKIAQELYEPIRWCAEYCRRMETPEGVIRSDTDELEGRIPTDGYANLSTSCLCYGGLLAAAKLADSLGDHQVAVTYRSRAEALSEAIETYFGAELHGYPTYRYSQGFDTLRSWICLPLCVGLSGRATGTVEAMLSDYLWTEEGMLSCEISQDNRNSTIWDRSSLYGFKALFQVGCGDRAMKHLLKYCRKRLLCDRVPYAVEAYPEGDKRHLSAESALFVRVITEGMLGIEPESLESFSFVPQLPKDLEYIDMDHLYIAGHQWHIRVERTTWTVYRNGALFASGATEGKRIYL